ncbi:MAG TPA: hypothetical protein VI731_09955 [Bacteroidia bacterium]|nr:hypothetical protein [Bacteroidia bacterium]
MKRLLTVLFILGGLAFANSAYAQAPTEPEKKKEKKEQKDKKSTSTGDLPDEIAIDEDGQSKPPPNAKKPGTTADSTKVQPKNAAVSGPAPATQAPQAPPAPPSPPAPIAIDEDGQSKPPASPIAIPKPASPDSSKTAPANELIRPQD